MADNESRLKTTLKKPLSRVLSVILMVFFSGLSEVQARQTLEEVYADAIQLFENDNYSGYEKLMKLADEMRPNHRVIMYRLASAYTLNSKPDEAVRVLSSRIDYYAFDDFSKDTLFQNAFSPGDMDALIAKVELLNTEVNTSVPAFQIDKKGFHGEGIMYSDYLNTFLIGDARCGEILSVDEKGEKSAIIADLKSNGFWGAFGMAQDTENPRYIWIASSALFNFCEAGEETKGKAAILKYDLETDQVIFSYSADGNHVFGDLTIGPEGHIYFTDSMKPNIYKTDHSTLETEILFTGEEYWNLQGIAVTDKFIYFSDYITGIYHFNRSTKEINAVSKNNQKLRGSDGIYSNGSGLLLLQNGTQPMKVRYLNLSGDGFENQSSSRIIDAALEGLNEPTLGTLYGDQFYFLFNSPWAYYSDEGYPELDKWPVLNIHSVSVK